MSDELHSIESLLQGDKILAFYKEAVNAKLEEAMSLYGADHVEQLPTEERRRIAEEAKALLMLDKEIMEEALEAMIADLAENDLGKLLEIVERLKPRKSN